MTRFAPDAPRYRRDMHLAGMLTMINFAIGTGYCLFTLDQPHHPVILAVWSFGVLMGIAVLVRRVHSLGRATRRALMVGLSMTSTAIVTIGAMLDGGAGSPAAFGFFPVMIFIAISTPPRVLIPLEVFNGAAYLVVAAVGAPTRPGYVFISLAGMIGTISICAMQGSLVARQRAELRLIAHLDPLTGALNRRGLEFRAADSAAAEAAVICLDFDGFKQLNDTQGHAAGDDLLCWSVAAMRTVLRADDLVVRLGGDEFAVVLSRVDDVEGVKTRLVRALGERIAASAGTASAPRDGATVADLMAVADKRLYDVKRNRKRSAPLPQADDIAQDVHPAPAGGAKRSP
ncbi:GGDEF domain-containing protein [Actinoplanes sp. NPDC049681]|uniref:GGDEF domain-containing protein n=1 Tax=Actinoplanes sp. NPDC049681 TaxID=3363905 RepID=UPI0037A24F84